jgi:hypothetical protein
MKVEGGIYGEGIRRGKREDKVMCDESIFYTCMKIS